MDGRIAKIDFWPHVTSRYHTLPHVTARYLTAPHVTARYLTLPHVTSRYLTLPHVTSRYRTLPHVTSRYRTLPHFTSRYHTLPHVIARYLTLPHVTIMQSYIIFIVSYILLPLKVSRFSCAVLQSACLKNSYHSRYHYLSSPIPQDLSRTVYHTPVGLEHGRDLAPFSAELSTNVPSLFPDFLIHSRRIIVH
jgi:hypothetical protein